MSDETNIATREDPWLEREWSATGLRAGMSYNLSTSAQAVAGIEVIAKLLLVDDERGNSDPESRLFDPYQRDGLLNGLVALAHLAHVDLDEAREQFQKAARRSRRGQAEEAEPAD